MRIACSATGNSMEAGAGLILRVDPRYFRVPNRPLKHRVGNVVRLTFVARSYGGSFRPAYARYMATVGNNFLSNTGAFTAKPTRSTRSCVRRRLRRTHGGHAFEEFWPDVKKRVFHKRKQNYFCEVRESTGKSRIVDSDAEVFSTA
jgi:hypothetical protein